MTANIRSLIQNLDVDGVVELFELNLSPITGNSSDRYLMYAGTNQNDQAVVWNGETYNPYPFQMKGFEKRTQGTQPRPSLNAGNASGLLTALSLAYDDLVGAQVIRRKTLVRFLDRANFPARKNLLVDTRDWGSTWVTVRSSKTLAGSTGPAVQANVLQLVSDTSAATSHYVVQGSVQGDASQPATLSVFVKDAGQRYFNLYVTDQSTQSKIAQARFDLTLGKFVSSTTAAGAVVLGQQIVKMGDTGWFRVSLTFNVNGTGTLRTLLLLSAASSTNFTGDGVSGVLLCAPQMEQGSATTTYQPIVGTTYDANPDADPTQKFPDEMWMIERKVKGNKNSYEWELVTATDLEGFQLPARPISANVCPFRYRGGSGDDDGCTYAGTSYFDAQDNPMASAGQDVCSKSLQGCKVRFGSATLPFGGFPGSRSYRF